MSARSAVMRRPVLEADAVTRQDAVITRLKRSAPPSAPVAAERNALVSAIEARFESLLVPLEEALGQSLSANVEPTRHPPRAVCVAFDVSMKDDATGPLAMVYLDRNGLDRLVSVQCGVAGGASRDGQPVTPFETAIATAFLRTLSGAATGGGDDWTLVARTEPEPDVDVAGDVTVSLSAVSRGMVGDVLARARIQLTQAGGAMLSGSPTDAAERPKSNLTVAPVRLRALMTLPKMPLAAIRGLRAGQTLPLGDDATVALMTGRRRLAEGHVQSGIDRHSQRRIAITAFSNTGISES